MADATQIESRVGETYTIGLRMIDSSLYGFGADELGLNLVYSTGEADSAPFRLKFSERLSYDPVEAVKDEQGDTLTAAARKFKGYGGRHISFTTFLFGLSARNSSGTEQLSADEIVSLLKIMASKHRAQQHFTAGAPQYPKNMITMRGGKTVTVPYHAITTYPEVSRVPLLVFMYGNITVSPCVITGLDFNYRGWRAPPPPSSTGLAGLTSASRPGGISEAEVTVEMQELLNPGIANWVPSTGGEITSSIPFKPSFKEYKAERSSHIMKRVKSPEAEVSVGREAAPAVITKRARTNREWIRSRERGRR